MKYLFLLITLCCFGIGQSQESNIYSKFKTGKFSYEGNSGKVEIIRTEKKNIEIFNNGKSKLINEIKWINDSTYILTHKKSINASGCLDKGDWVKSTIIKVDGNSYTIKAISNKCGEGQTVIHKTE
ncbi:hypothetical protein [Moheibacter sediminis]|uniref:Uncharacterized protein n=1 Tax=Moheibacter sediminis TaxID=1434700 RepID=A0A1W2C7V1_9FLAO|nr:hypothetical protein [Moheibacter sediminis]SMC81345.1 hypothetical protein SAMN06296427_10972 [Moheibacter sediminis]